ncbi:integrase family protein [Kutzneria sp. CA-103260]|nr:integrase family protein [Kutzneria sp. CA-103260]
MHRIRATLRKALNDAIPQGLITVNPACHVELPPARRPKPLVWTRARVQWWRETGQIPSSVMVWTPEQAGRFLDHAQHDRLYPLFHLITFRGLRRGEACGAHWSDLDEESRELGIRWQLLQLGWETELADPKTEDSDAVIALDEGTLRVLAAHRVRQRVERQAAGAVWPSAGLMFTEQDGQPLHPAKVTDRFKELVVQAGLPPIRLHDLRHGAATLALAAGVEMKVVQAMLRHSSITITSDTYTSVLSQVAREAADATARMVPRKVASCRVDDRVTLGLPSGPHASTMDSEMNVVETQNIQVNDNVDLDARSAAPGTRTPNPLIKSQLLCQLS